MWNVRLALAIGGRDGVDFDIGCSDLKFDPTAIGNPQSQQVPELRLFCFEIFFVVRIGFSPDRHLLDHFQTITLQADNFLRIIGEEPELPHAQIEKNLSAKPVISQVSCVSEFRVGLYGVESFLLQLVGVDFCRQPDTAALLSHAARLGWNRGLGKRHA